MSASATFPADDAGLSLQADVPVIGGSLAGAGAAITAAEAGACIVLAEKGWVGTAGVVAAATGGGYYLLPDDEAQRRRMIGFRHADADELDDPTFIKGVYDESYRAYLKIKDWASACRRPAGSAARTAWRSCAIG